MFNGNTIYLVRDPIPKQMMAEICLLRPVRDFEVNRADWRDHDEWDFVSGGEDSSIVRADLTSSQ